VLRRAAHIPLFRRGRYVLWTSSKRISAPALAADLAVFSTVAGACSAISSPLARERNAARFPEYMQNLSDWESGRNPSSSSFASFVLRQSGEGHLQTWATALASKSRESGLVPDCASERHLRRLIVDRGILPISLGQNCIKLLLLIGVRFSSCVILSTVRARTAIGLRSTGGWTLAPITLLRARYIPSPPIATPNTNTARTSASARSWYVHLPLSCSASKTSTSSLVCGAG